jgi:hypothetical protein
VRAEAAALDPNATLDDVVRVDNAAARARAKLSDLIGLRRKPAEQTLQEYARSKAKAEGDPS